MANEAKQFTIGGVTHDVMDVGARQLIADLQTAIDAITSGDTTTAIKTFQEVINFLDGVTDDATLIGKLNELRTLINAKYSKPAGGIPASDLASGVIPDVSGFATKTEVNAKANSADVYSKSEVDGKVGKILNINPNDVNRATPYRVWVGTQAQLSALSELEEDVIYLVGRVPSASHSVTKSGIGQHITVSGTDASTQQVDDGGTFTITLSVASGYTMDAVVVMMDGVNITASAYNSSTGVINISNVTGDIVISATATKHIASIALSAGARNGFVIPLTASVLPVDADNVSLEWSIDNTEDFSISGNGASATLTIKSSAVNANVNITCYDTNALSGISSGTLQLTGLYYNNPVPITALGGVSYVAGQNVNSYQFAVEVTPSDGNTPAIVWSVVASPANAASIDSDTGLLTINADCSVVVTATAGQLSSSSSSIALTHAADPDAPIVWEDSIMEAFMLDKVTHANPNYITIAEAANYTNSSFGSNTKAASWPFGNIQTLVTKFNEWKYFTGLTKVNLTGFSSLTEVSMPSTVILDDDGYQLNSGTFIKDTAVANVVIPEGVTIMAGLRIQGESVETISFPSTLENITQGLPACPNVKILDFSGTSLAVYGFRSGTAAQIVKFPHTLEDVSNNGNVIQLTRYWSNIVYISFGDSVNGSSLDVLNVSGYGATKQPVLVLYGTTPPTTFEWDNGNKPSAIYVPDGSVETYKEAAGFTSYSNVIYGIGQLPVGWDTPVVNE